ncbi:8-oxo-dGTP diphosphatase [Pseudoxanthomonas sp. SORGH_AS 997]|uniref:8-oxo-dGTP diphosphatase n=1 Tax=Pseudoxanthomonas winnipegensis TaxID=2480810 RepID=A0AAW8GCD5_9GAMM|nr:8-oxo-dGTP diphosphatase [Pseudoxanthomonas winnipegensis]MDQ1133295.1 8-oxo-dGTP diphosphatase [Pseudoxanthomonas winnipegensis]MDR6136710.1 8-oxo-dGTP diphosphatase [Pseudoxanthomonas sp. SORGH_AS_0997]
MVAFPHDRCGGRAVGGCRVRVRTFPSDDPAPPVSTTEPAPLRFIHVVAAAITDARGRLLLARRGDGRDLAGLWEFPGGKREPGESTEETLVRELQEELGITVQVGAPIMRVPHLYPDKRLLLDVRRVTTWKGVPRGMEGQALAWVAQDKLQRYPMPAADKPVVAVLQQPDRYLITPEPGADSAAWLAGLEAALAGGVRRVRLRARGLEGDAGWPPLAAAAVALCREAGAEVLLEGAAKLARDLGVGLHLRTEQLMRIEARPVAAGVGLAASCRSAEHLRRAEALGCDFVTLGPVRGTDTQPTLGWDAFAALREIVSLPIYATGGLGLDDMAQAHQHGAQGIAALRGLWPSG